ncbi:MAG: S1 RNA-binding domain-containing protein [Elusimicrobia bacterium]|nr:S1 RNA-binding domain-containing protein [Elusimicrobiota bacterium]
METNEKENESVDQAEVSAESTDPAEAAAEPAQTGETMESLLAQQAAVTDKLAHKHVAWVKVITVTKEQVLVDIGEKREGVVPLAEFTSAALPSVGQRIPVILVGPRRDVGTVLSYKKAKAELGWEAAVKAHAEKARVRGQVQSAIKGGFLVDVAGVAGFLPASLADLRPVRNPARMVHTGVRCYIIELNAAKRQLVLSRKAVLEEEVNKRRTKLLGELRVGEVRIGRVVQVSPAGLLVDIGGAEGFVRAADIAWGTAAAPAHERGAKVRVKILSKPAAASTDQLLLGMKQLTPNPVDAIRKKYPPKTVVHGKVTESGAGGVKMVLDDKKIAFCPPAEMDPDTACKPGDSVSAIVLGVNSANFEVSVSIGKFEEIRSRKRVAQYLKAPKPLTLGQLLSPEKGE